MKKLLLYGVLTVSVILNILTVFIITTQNPMNVQGQMSWNDLYSNDSDATEKFLKDTLGIKVIGMNTLDNNSDKDFNYKILQADKAVFPFSGLMQITDNYKKEGMKPHSTIYLTVKNYETAAEKFKTNGAKAIIENMEVKNMKFGFYNIPGGIEIGIVEYLK